MANTRRDQDGMEYKKVALVIGAGDVKCAAALGALRVLRGADVALDLVVGGSSGALIAAAIALGWPEEKTVALARSLWTPQLTIRRNTRALLQAALPTRLGFDGRFGLRDDGLLRRQLETAFGAQTFADTQIPLMLTATDFATGEQVTLQKGRLASAIRAAMAMPFVFAPWPVDGRLLVDGYLSDPLPANVAIREGAGVIVALGFESPPQQTIDSPLRYALQLSSIMINSMFKARVAFHALMHHTDIVLLAPQFGQRVGPFDGHKLPLVIAAGGTAMSAQLPSLQAALDRRTLPEKAIAFEDQSQVRP